MAGSVAGSGEEVEGTVDIDQLGSEWHTAWRRPCHRRRCVRPRPPPSGPMRPGARGPLWAGGAGRATPPAMRSEACPPRCAPGGSPMSGGATAPTGDRCARPGRLPPSGARCPVAGRVRRGRPLDEGSSIPKRMARERTDDPESFMYVVGTARATRRPASVTTAARAPTPFSARSDAPWRSANSSTVSDPALCRLPANSDPGLPSPTTSRSAGVPRCSDRAKGRRRA